MPESGSATTCLVIDGLGVPSALERSPEGSWAGSESCTGNGSEGVHGGCGGPIDVYGRRCVQRAPVGSEDNLEKLPKFRITLRDESACFC